MNKAKISRYARNDKILIHVILSEAERFLPFKKLLPMIDLYYNYYSTKSPH